MKKLMLVIACFLLLGVWGLACDEDEKEVEVTWKASVYTVEGDYLTTFYQNFADLVKEKSDGRMEITVYTGGTLYSLDQTYDAISSGSLDTGFGLVTTVFGKVPKTASLQAYANCLGIPQVDVAEVVNIEEALNSEMEAIKQEAAANNVMPLLWVCVSPTDFFFTEPVETLEDIQGMKLGSIEAVAPIIQALGATPVVLDAADFYQSAQTGVIDGIAIIPIDNYLDWKLYSVLPYAILSDLTTSACCCWMNSSSFDDLPTDLQDALMEAASEAQSRGIDDFLTYYNDTLQELEDNPDVNLYVLPESEREQWLGPVTAVYEGLIAQFLTPEEVTQAKEIVAGFME